MKKYLLHVLFLAGCIAIPLPAAELVSINNVTLVDADSNDGDSFRVNADGRELHLRLYYVDCLETTYNSKGVLERIRKQQYHFGLEDPHDVVRYGEQATEYVKEVSIPAVHYLHQLCSSAGTLCVSSLLRVRRNPRWS